MQLLSLFYKTPTYPEDMHKDIWEWLKLFMELERKVLMQMHYLTILVEPLQQKSEIQVSKVECDVNEVPVLLELEPYSSTSDINLETLATGQQSASNLPVCLYYNYT